MAQKALDQFSIDFVTKGSRQVMRDMQDVIKKMNEMQQVVEGNTSAIDRDTEQQKRNTDAHNKNTQSITKQNSALWTYAKRLVSVYALYKLVQKGVGLAVNFAEKGNAYANMATVSGASAESIQKWGYALRRFGGNEQSAASTLGALQAKLYDYRMGYGKDFNEFMSRGGSVVGTTAEEFLKNLARQMQGWSADKQRNMANTLGLDASTTAFLMQGADAVEKALKSAQALFNPEDIKAAQEAKENLEEFNRELEKLGIVIGKVLLPYLTEALKYIRDFIQFPDKVSKKILGGSYDILEKIGGAFVPETEIEREIFEQKYGKRGYVGYYLGKASANAKQQFRTITGMDFIADNTFAGIVNAGNTLKSLPGIMSSGIASNISNMFSQDNSIVINGAASPERTGSEVIRQISNWSGESIFNEVIDNIGGRQS